MKLTTTAWVLAVTSVACWRNTPSNEPPATNPVEVTISSVTLGDDCGGMVASIGDGEAEAESQKRSVDRDSSGDHECVQTSLQLKVKAGAQASSLRVKRIELIAPDGKSMDLTANVPLTWSSNGTYKRWDQTIAANESKAVSYTLASPDWNQLGGRWAAQSRQFQVRVTLTVDANERVFETKAAVAAMIEPMIET